MYVSLGKVNRIDFASVLQAWGDRSRRDQVGQGGGLRESIGEKSGIGEHLRGDAKA